MPSVKTMRQVTTNRTTLQTTATILMMILLGSLVAHRDA